MRGRRLVLAYHGIRPAGEPPAGEHVLYVEQARFEEQLDILADLAEVVPLGKLLASEDADGPRPRVAITWDDAYAGALDAGLAALGSRGMATTIFAAPGCLGGRAFWWDRLAARHRGVVPAALRTLILTRYAGDDQLLAAGFEGLEAEAALPAWCRTADQATLVRAASRPGVEVASHSWSHPNLAAVSPERLEGELRRSLDWLAATIPGFRPWLALPYGLGGEAVRKGGGYGHEAVFLVHGGWLPGKNVDPAALPRLNVPAGLTVDGFVLRLRGLLCG